MIRDGFFDGKLIGGAWSVNSSELKEDRSNSNEIGFFEKLLNGDFSLPIHYWLFTVVGNFVLKLLFVGFESARNYYGVMFVLVMVIVYNIPILVGLWRAAVKYKGPPIWKVLVQSYVYLVGWSDWQYSHSTEIDLT